VGKEEAVQELAPGKCRGFNGKKAILGLEAEKDLTDY